MHALHVAYKAMSTWPWPCAQHILQKRASSICYYFVHWKPRSQQLKLNLSQFKQRIALLNRVLVQAHMFWVWNMALLRRFEVDNDKAPSAPSNGDMVLQLNYLVIINIKIDHDSDLVPNKFCKSVQHVYVTTSYTDSLVQNNSWMKKRDISAIASTQCDASSKKNGDNCC